MTRAPRFDIVTPRHQPFRFEIGFPNLDLTGRAFSFQARANREADPALLNLNSGDGANAIGFQVLQIDGLAYSLVTINADKAAMEAFPLPTPLDSDSDNWHSFKVDGIEYLTGAFTVTAQANHN